MHLHCGDLLLKRQSRTLQDIQLLFLVRYPQWKGFKPSSKPIPLDFHFFKSLDTGTQEWTSYMSCAKAANKQDILRRLKYTWVTMYILTVPFVANSGIVSRWDKPSSICKNYQKTTQTSFSKRKCNKIHNLTLFWAQTLLYPLARWGSELVVRAESCFLDQAGFLLLSSARCSYARPLLHTASATPVYKTESISSFFY